MTSRHPPHVTSRHPPHRNSIHPLHVTSRHPPHVSSRHPPNVTSRHPSHLTSRHHLHVTSRHPSHLTSKHPTHVTSRHLPHMTSRHPPHGTSRHPPRVTSRHPLHVTSRHPPHVTSRHVTKLFLLRRKADILFIRFLMENEEQLSAGQRSSCATAIMWKGGCYSTRIEDFLNFLHFTSICKRGGRHLYRAIGGGIRSFPVFTHIAAYYLSYSCSWHNLRAVP